MCVKSDIKLLILKTLSVLVALFRQQPGEKFQGSTSYRKVVYIPSIYYNKASRIRRIIHTGVKQAYSILYTKAYLWRTRMTSEHPSANRNVNEVISTTLQETTQTLFFLTAGVKLTSFGLCQLRTGVDNGRG